LGVDHFFLYNNFSEDNYLEVLDPYISKGIVTLHDWPYPITNGNEQNFVQVNAMNHCMQHSNSEWIAVIDVDEFIVPCCVDSLKDFLKTYDKQNTIGAIYINWFMYGTSYVYEIPKNKLLIETLTRRGEKGSNIGKTIVRPKAVSLFRDTHRPLLNPFCLISKHRPDA